MILERARKRVFTFKERKKAPPRARAQKLPISLCALKKTSDEQRSLGPETLGRNCLRGNEVSLDER